MARPRTATNVLQLRGAFKKDPQRARQDVKTGRDVGAAPSKQQLTFPEAWDYLVRCCPRGVLDERDRVYLEIAASLFVEFRANFADMPAPRLARLEMMLGKLGMTPVDASRVKADTGPAKNEFED